MRSASLAYVQQAIKARLKPTTKTKEHIKDARRSVAGRYLQLKSGHTVTGAHLLRIESRTVLVVWPEQPDCCSPLAGVPEVAKAASHYAREMSQSAKG